MTSTDTYHTQTHIKQNELKYEHIHLQCSKKKNKSMLGLCSTAGDIFHYK